MRNWIPNRLGRSACQRRTEFGSSKFRVHSLRLRMLSGSSKCRVRRLWMSTGWDVLLCRFEDTVSKESKTGSAVHGALDDLETVDMPLDGASTPGLGQGRMNGVAVLAETAGKALEAAALGGVDPGVQVVSQLALDHLREALGKVDGVGNRRRQVQQRGHKPTVLLGQRVGWAHQQAGSLARSRWREGLGRRRFGRAFCASGWFVPTPSGRPLPNDS